MISTNLYENSLSNEERLRYQRHLTLPNVGEAGQLKLKQAKVLVVGAGGLGCPALLYLNAAGVGTIGIVDGDVVSLSNLQRQILYTEQDVGKLKTEVAQQQLAKQNPHTHFVLYNQYLSVENIFSLFQDQGYELVLDCTDNFSSRYLINDACFFQKIPLIHGSVQTFAGLAGLLFAKTQNSAASYCYRCLFPTPPLPAAGILNCTEAGVLGDSRDHWQLASQFSYSIPTIAAFPQWENPIFTTFDFSHFQFRSLKIQRDEFCPLCGINPTIMELKQEHYHCQSQIQIQIQGQKNMQNIALADFQFFFSLDQANCENNEWKKFVIDIREKNEVEEDDHDFTNIPLSLFEKLFTSNNSLSVEFPFSFDPQKKYLLCCASGKRSQYAIQKARELGWENFYSLQGGLQKN